MPKQQLIVASWDNACPSGVSYAAHILGLPLRMVELYFQAGGKGVFLTNPMTVSMLSMMSTTFSALEFEWNGPTEDPIDAGRLGGVKLFATMAVPPNEILVVEDADSLQPTAKVELTNFVSVPGPLDRLAQVS